MIDFVKQILGMSLSTTKVIALACALLITILLLGKYPIEYDRISYEVKDYVKITKTDKYIVQTELHKDGLKVRMTTKTYYVKVDEKPDSTT